MRFRATMRMSNARWTALTACVALLCLAHGSPAADRKGEKPSESEVAAAIETLKADPDLSIEKKRRVLKWKGDDNEEEEPPPEPAQWLLDFIKWIAESGRLVAWLLIATLVGLLVVLVLRAVRDFRPARSARRFEAPTHVQELDIRPESLPDDVGAAAAELWQRGQHRAALSLLYRGTLSRMVHSYELPIRHSTTEGDCLALARERMEKASGNYVGRLVRLWQRAVYGGYEPADEDVHSLCRDFDVALRAHAGTEASP